MSQEIYKIGKYRLSSVISRGKSGDVWLSHDPNLDVPVAIKILYPGDGSLGSVARFQREAATAATITHPNLVRVYAADADDNVHYIVMEYLPGGTAKELLGMPFSPEQVARVRAVILDTARGLEALHNKGFVHRDVKPTNVLFADDGTTKVADLGIGKRFDSEEHGLTTTGNMIGTPYYLAPERAMEPDTIDQRCDLYSLGCMWYHLATGCVPFDGDSAMQVIIKHLHEDRPDPRELNPHLSDTDAEAMRKLMARPPGKRFQTAGELIAELSQAETLSTPVVAPEPAANRFAAYYARLTALLAILVLVVAGVLALRSPEPVETEFSPPFHAAVNPVTPIIWIPIPTGTYAMGSDAPADSTGDGPAALPRHKVTIATPFAIADAPITRAQFAAFCQATNYLPEYGRFPPSPVLGNQFPATMVSWHDAMAYCHWLTERDRASGKLDQQLEYRLPTEAEWEYGARADTNDEYWFGSDPADVARYANVDANQLLSARSFPPNPWGLYDVHGGVWEWCLDAPRGYQSVAELNPTGPLDGSHRAIRGGSWNSPPLFARIASRAAAPVTATRDDLGFRIVRAPISRQLAANTN